MIEHIRQSNLIEDITDPGEVDQSLIAWRELEQVEPDGLGHFVVQSIQKIIVANQTNLQDNQRGQYRDASNTNVRVGGYRAPAFSAVRPLMDEWLGKISTADPLESHIEFENIHPFADGNGRTGRMLMWWHEIHIGKEPTLFTLEDRQRYYQLFSRGKEDETIGQWWMLIDTYPELFGLQKNDYHKPSSIAAKPKRKKKNGSTPPKTNKPVQYTE